MAASNSSKSIDIEILFRLSSIDSKSNSRDSKSRSRSRNNSPERRRSSSRDRKSRSRGRNHSPERRYSKSSSRDSKSRSRNRNNNPERKRSSSRDSKSRSRGRNHSQERRYSKSRSRSRNNSREKRRSSSRDSKSRSNDRNRSKSRSRHRKYKSPILRRVRVLSRSRGRSLFLMRTPKRFSRSRERRSSRLRGSSNWLRSRDRRSKSMQRESQCLSFSSHERSSSSRKDTEIGKKRLIIVPIHDEHVLKLSPTKALYSCSGCKEKGYGPSYHCKERGCSYVLHEECAKAVFHPEVPASHSFFKGEKFWFLENPPGEYLRVCNACRRDVHGFVYHRKPTEEDTGLDLHPCCLMLRDISYKDSYATKTLTLQRNVPKNCVQCKHRKVGDHNKVKGWSYLTLDGDCYHVSCFKELFLEKLKDEETNSKASSSLENKIVSKISPVTKIASLVLKLIFAAIFGNPVSFVFDVVEALAKIAID